MRTWRLIIDGPGDGAWNMAVDRALLASHEVGKVAPTLRLYRWRRPTVSLGRFQSLEDVDLELCASEGIDVCRRPTGGRGVLHDDEVTYSIVAGVRDGLPRGVGASYRVLCGALVEAYRELGVHADLTARPRGERSAGACYLHASNADLSHGIAKLSGSAQVWSRDSCLQHGSFVISRDIDREAAVFRLDAAGRRALAGSTRTICDALGSRPDDREILERLVTGLERGLGVSFEPASIGPREIQEAEIMAGGFRVAESAG